MSQFKDTTGQQWQFRITHADAMRVKQQTSIRLYHLLDEKLKGLEELLGNPEQLVSVIASLLEDQLEEAGVSGEDFATRIDGAVLEAMGAAFMEALTDFFPNPRAREMLRELLPKAKKVEQLMSEKMTENLLLLTPEKIMQRAMNGAETKS